MLSPTAQPIRRSASSPRNVYLLLLIATLLAACQAESTSRFTPIQSIFQRTVGVETPSDDGANASKTKSRWSPKPEQIEKERQARRQRHRERNERVKEAIKSMRPSNVERVANVDVDKMINDHEGLRRNLWGSGGSTIEYLDPGQDYDMWSQAYRMLGGFIDCDHKKDENDSHDNNDNNDNNEVSSGCSRWMMWASYVDPNYQGYGYYEYHGDEPVGTLDCHVPESDWQLLGVYRQEFYQFIEQISKHLWRIDEYEYVVALAGLAYMTDYDCFYVGTSNSGDSIYAGVAPQPKGKFEMALYTDDDCLVPDDSLGMTFDDFGLTSNVKLESGDEGNGDDDTYAYAQEWWADTQEYTLTQLNDVYEDFKYCTSCIDYPTYQDGYYIGDTGTDDDDLINQCWKFYSHDSFTCESDCVALAHSQGTIVSVELGGVLYGTVLSEYYSGAEGIASASTTESSFSRLIANAFVTFSFIVFIATFLAFAVARRSRYRESRTARTRRLLDDERPRRSRRSKSRAKGSEGDGIFRTSTGSRKSRSKSGSRRSKSKSRSSRRRDEGDREHSRSKDEYEPPTSPAGGSRRSSSRNKRSSSRNRRSEEPPPDEF